MKNRYWIIGFTVLIVVCGILWMTGGYDNGSLVGIYQDGELLYEIDLSKVIEPYELTVEYNGNKNIILVEHNDISVIDADCPDHVCIEHGSLGDKTPIVCLPNRLVIEWINDKGKMDVVI